MGTGSNAEDELGRAVTVALCVLAALAVAIGYGIYRLVVSLGR